MTDFILYQLFPMVFNMSVTAGVVIFFVLLARLLLKRAPKVFSYALWAVVLFRLLCPVSLTAGFSLLGMFDAPVQQATAHTGVVEYMDPLGKIANFAFMCSGAFVFGDHLGFTAGVDKSMVLPLIAGKLIAGVLALALSLLVGRKMLAKGEAHPIPAEAEI